MKWKCLQLFLSVSLTQDATTKTARKSHFCAFLDRVVNNNKKLIGIVS